MKIIRFLYVMKYKYLYNNNNIEVLVFEIQVQQNTNYKYFKRQNDNWKQVLLKLLRNFSSREYEIIWIQVFVM